MTVVGGAAALASVAPAPPPSVAAGFFVMARASTARLSPTFAIYRWLPINKLVIPVVPETYTSTPLLSDDSSLLTLIHVLDKVVKGSANRAINKGSEIAKIMRVN